MAATQHVPELDRILEALSISYDPYANNQSRHAALKYLDELKLLEESPRYGYLMANEASQHASVRQFGLSLLDTAIRYRWTGHTDKQADTIKEWVTSLASSVTERDTPYYRNKLAWLWVQLAKREWAASWLDMDELLWTLWTTQDPTKILVNRMLVLDILETLSDDVCVRDEPVAMLRQEALGQALNEIMIPHALYEDHLESRGTAQPVRYTEHGWLSIMCDSLRSLVDAPTSRLHTASYVGKILQALRPTVAWISLESLAQTTCPSCLMDIMSIGDVQARTAAVECLYDIVNRPYLAHLHEQWTLIIQQTLQPHYVDLLRQCYTAATVSAREIDDAKYTLSKKIAEVLSVLGDAVTRNPHMVGGQQLLVTFYDLIIIVFQSESLSLSLPIVHSICKTLGSQDSRLTQVLDQAASTLLGVCSQRLIRYEFLPANVEPDLVLYLREDFEALPEQHAFLGNYRRHCNTVISHVSQARPREALEHILRETLTVLKEANALDTIHYNKSSLPVLRLEAQLSVVKSSLDGFVRWACKMKSGAPSEACQALDGIASDLQEWCRALMTTTSDHPDIARLAIQLLVEVASKVQDISGDFVQALMVWLLDVRTGKLYTDLQHMEAVKAFNVARLVEMQRLATAYPNFLYSIYNDLEQRINLQVSHISHDSRTAWGLRTILIILCHRAFVLDKTTRLQRLRHMTEEIATAWSSTRLVQGLSSRADFLRLIGLEDLSTYLTAAAFDKVQNWSAHPLDAAGANIQSNADKSLDDLPLRMTLSILGATTDRLTEGSDSYNIARALWGPLISQVLPNLIVMLNNATAFADPGNWATLPQQQQRTVRDMFADRFWQSGISNETKDDFSARISRNVTTYEGFAATVRGTPRSVRDCCYQIIHKLSRFDEEFYGLEDLPGPLADALLSQAHWLSVHHQQRILALVERLVTKCPPYRRPDFLPRLLALTFAQLDRKISTEWERIDTARETEASPEGDELGEEMKAESVVRTTTFAVVNLITVLLEISRQNEQSPENNGHSQSQKPRPPTLRRLVLSEITVLEPLILICTHILRMRDSRCCGTIARLLTSTLPSFLPQSPNSANQVVEYISTHVLKAAITSLNDPHFVDCQKDLAALITGIISHYSPFSPTPRSVLLSLPDMSEVRVDTAINRVTQLRSAERKARAVVLDLLDSVRGVSIAEAGKINHSEHIRRPNGGEREKRAAERNKSSKAWLDRALDLQGNGMVVEDGRAWGRQQSSGLEGIGEMFGDSAAATGAG